MSVKVDNPYALFWFIIFTRVKKGVDSMKMTKRNLMSTSENDRKKTVFAILILP